MTRVFGASVILSAAVFAVAALPSTGLASGGSAFGQHVAGCAQEHLGHRTAPPSVTCTMPDGTAMTFPNFGAMVQHGRNM
jgi:hypothetical protein